MERALRDSYSDTIIVEEEIFQAVIAEINGLPEKYATILQFKYLHDLDYAQIAEKLKMTEVAVGKQKQRAMEMLQTIIVKKKLLSATALVVLLERLHV